ncbi:unnamed protein product [Vicia faba]|uniref:Uncharacterized protein n=1 Tax=Vicia faba TaxID=3906 RepID=A0AAV1AVZ7_VICFA|nr:unnamed protein product [Vicia faba]
MGRDAEASLLGPGAGAAVGTSTAAIAALIEAATKRTAQVTFFMFMLNLFVWFLRSAFKGISGRYFLEKLDAVASLIHLKEAYHDMEGKLIVVNADPEEAKRIKEIILKDIFVSSVEAKESPRNVNIFELDALEDKVKPLCDNEFEAIQLNDNPFRSIKIISKFPFEVH